MTGLHLSKRRTPSGINRIVLYGEVFIIQAFRALTHKVDRNQFQGELQIQFRDSLI